MSMIDNMMLKKYISQIGLNYAIWIKITIFKK